MNEGVIGDNYPEANSPVVDMSDGEINDVELTNAKGNDVEIFGTESNDDNDDVNFHYDDALDVAFDDSNEGVVMMI